MIGPPGSILTLGLGGSPSLMVTLGYGIGEAVVVIRNIANDIAVLTQRQITKVLTTGTAFSVLTVPIGHIVTLTDDDITV